MRALAGGDRSTEPASSAELDRRFMRRAIDLADRGYGRVAPNPLVGAVVVSDEGEIAGEGWHAAYGEDHAEAGALRGAGERARGGTLYVTLEPCAHSGKTPPCAPAVVESGIARVVIACRDPDATAAGGAELLRREGLRVETGLLGRTAARGNASFLWSRIRDRPFVTLKLALSLDGRIAAREGTRTAITGDEAAGFVHRLRAGHDAILVGRETACVDDPLLTARGEVTPRRPPVRVVLDSRLSLPRDSRLLRTTREAPVWIFCGPEAPADRLGELASAGARVRRLPRGDGGLDLGELLDHLHEEGIDSVMVEGGGRIAASFLREERLQRMCLAYAPVLLGPEGVEAFPDPDAGRLSRWRPRERRSLGRDTLLVFESRDLEAALSETHGCSPG